MANKTDQTRPDAALSDTERKDAERAAQAAIPQAVTAGSPSATPAVQPVTGMRVRFTAKDPSKAKTDSGTTLATASLLGCFGAFAIDVHGLALSLRDRDRTVAIYMPGPMYQRSIGPAQIALAQPIVVNGKAVTHADDPAGTRDMAKLEQSIRDAWAMANASGSPFNREWPLSL